MDCLLQLYNVASETSLWYFLYGSNIYHRNIYVFSLEGIQHGASGYFSASVLFIAGV